MTELLVGLSLIVGVVAAHEIGFWLGSLSRSIDKWVWFVHSRPLWSRF